MIEVYIKNETDFVKVDVFENTIFSLNKQLTDLQDLTTITVDYTKTVSLPRSSVNDQVFNCSFDTSRQQFSIDTSKKIDCRLVSNGNVLMEGYCILNSIDEKQYDITIYGQVGSLFKKFFEIPNEEVVQPTTLNANLVARSFRNGPLQYDSNRVNTITFDNRFNLPVSFEPEDDLTIDSVNIDLTGQGISSTETNDPDNAYFSIFGSSQWSYCRPFVLNEGVSKSISPIDNYDIINYHFESENNAVYKATIALRNSSSGKTIMSFTIPNEFRYKQPVTLSLPAGTYKKIKIIKASTGTVYTFLPYYDGEFKLVDASSGITIKGNSGELDEDASLQVIGFCATHQGQYNEFDSTRVSDGRTLPMDPYNDRYTGLTEHTLKEFRSYYQQPYIYLRPLFLRLRDYVNQSSDFEGYKLQYDSNWFNDNNPYWTRLVRMGRHFNEREDTHKDGPENPFVLNPSFVGASKTCQLNVNDSQTLTFQRQPSDFNIINNNTIQKPDDVKLLKGNLAHAWTCKLKESRTNVTHNRNKYSLHFAVSITNQIDTRYWAGVEQQSWNGYFNTGDVFIDPENCFILTITTGSHSESYGFYTAWNEEKKELLLPNQENFFKSNNITNIYPITVNTESYYDEDENRITFLWDLGIGDMGFVSNSDTSFTYTIKMNGPLLKLRPYKMEIFAIGTKVTQLVYDCTDFAGITLGSFPIGNSGNSQFPDIEGYESEQGIEGNVFYSDYDSRRSNSVIGLDEVLSEEDTIMSLLIEYVKMFRLYFDIDYLNRTITVRDNYFDNYTVEDWTDKIDYSTLKIKPLVQNDEAVILGYKESDMKYNEQYKLKTGVYYGDGALRTKIDTNNTTKELLPGLETSCVSQEYYPSWGANTYRNILSKEACPVAIDNKTNSTESQKISIYGAYYFINEVQEIRGFIDYASVTPAKGEYIVSDDTYDEIANNEYCWAFSGVKIESDKFPYVDFATTEDDVNYGCVWYNPLKKYSDKVYDGAFYINALWQNYLFEIYNPNNKLITAKIRLTDAEYSSFKFNKLVVINDVLYLVNKIKDFNGTGLTNIELIQIYDPTNLMSQFNFIRENNTIRNPENTLM